jgi:hypothetical protein
MLIDEGRRQHKKYQQDKDYVDQRRQTDQTPSPLRLFNMH